MYTVQAAEFESDQCRWRGRAKRTMLAHCTCSAGIDVLRLEWRRALCGAAKPGPFVRSTVCQAVMTKLSALLSIYAYLPTLCATSRLLNALQKSRSCCRCFSTCRSCCTSYPEYASHTLAAVNSDLGPRAQHSLLTSLRWSLERVV